MKCMKRQLIKVVVISGILFIGISLNSTRVTAAEINELETDVMEVAENGLDETDLPEMVEEPEVAQAVLVEEEPEEIEVAQESTVEAVEAVEAEVLLATADENGEAQNGLDDNNVIKEMEDELAAIIKDVDELEAISWESGELYSNNELTYETAQEYIGKSKELLDDALENYEKIIEKYSGMSEKPEALVKAEEKLAWAQRNYEKAYAEYKRVWEDEGGELTYENYIFYSEANKGYYPFEYSYEEYLEQIEALEREREEYLDQPEKLQEIDQKLEELWEIAWSAEEYSKHPAGIYDDLVAEFKAAYENDVKPYVDKKDKAESSLEWAQKNYDTVYSAYNYGEVEHAKEVTDEATENINKAKFIYNSMRDGMDYVFGVDFNPNFEINTTFQGKQIHLKVDLKTKLRRSICNVDFCKLNICELICDCNKLQKFVCDHLLGAIGTIEVSVSDSNGMIYQENQYISYDLWQYYS